LSFESFFTLIIASKKDSEALVLEFAASRKLFGKTRLGLLEFKTKSL
jgi:hypothetical protein